MANFLDEAKDVTEEVGFKPKTSKKPKNFLDEAPDLGEAPKGAGKEVDPSLFEKALNVLDIPGSIVRTGAEAALSPDRDVLPAVKEQIARTIESPTTAAATAPRGVDVGKAAFPDFKKESIPGKVAGFVTETALDPLSWFTAGSAPVKTISKKLETASERQAAKALAKYANRADVLNEGVDLESIGARLVAEDLQGLVRDPVNLYKTLAGEKHIQKINPESLETLVIKRGKKQPGMIGNISGDISSALETVEKSYGKVPTIPANILSKQLLQKMKVSLSKTSGETVNLDKMREVLDRTLKPFKKMAEPIPPKERKSIYDLLLSGQTSDEALNALKKEKFTPEGINPLQLEATQTPNVLTLSEVQELRRNIGKQVSDRDFYKDPSQSMREETEVLRDLYKELGTVIEKQLEGKKLRIGNTLVDADKYYIAQNNRLKAFYDIQSMLEFAPTQELKNADIPAMLAKAGAKGAVFGGMGLGASLAGVPVNPLAGLGIGAMYGAGSSIADTVGKSTPEYLTSILKTAAKVAPAAVPSSGRGVIQYMREGEFVPTEGVEKFQRPEPVSKDKFKMFPSLMPSSSMITPREIINFKIPRTTQGILENKEKVLAKLAQNGVPGEMIDTIAMALDQDQEAVASIAPLVVTQFPTIFERSKYKVFDGQFLDPADRAKAADDISKRKDLGSIARAEMIDQINKDNKVPEGLV